MSLYLLNPTGVLVAETWLNGTKTLVNVGAVGWCGIGTKMLSNPTNVLIVTESLNRKTTLGNVWAVVHSGSGQMADLNSLTIVRRSA